MDFKNNRNERQVDEYDLQDSDYDDIDQLAPFDQEILDQEQPIEESSSGRAASSSSSGRAGSSSSSGRAASSSSSGRSSRSSVSSTLPTNSSQTHNVPLRKEVTIYDLLQMEEYESSDNYQLRVSLTELLMQIQKLSLSPPAAVILGNIIVKKMALGLTYDPEIEVLVEAALQQLRQK